MAEAVVKGEIFLTGKSRNIWCPGGENATKELLRQIEINENTNILIISGDDGKLAVELIRNYGCHVTLIGTDSKKAKKLNKLAAKKAFAKHISVAEGEIEKTGIKEETVDFILCEGVLTRKLPSKREAFLREAFRIIKTGGKLLIHEAAYMNEEVKSSIKKLDIEGRLKEYPLHIYEWEKLMDSFGFAIEECEYGELKSGMMGTDGAILYVTICSEKMK